MPTKVEDDSRRIAFEGRGTVFDGVGEVQLCGTNVPQRLDFVNTTGKKRSEVFLSTR
jgi:hypothetical protein